MSPTWDPVAKNGDLARIHVDQITEQVTRGGDVIAQASDIGGAGGNLTIRGGLGTPGHRDGVIQILRPDGRILTTIYPDGIVEFGPDYDPDETARAFWQVLGELCP